MPFRQFLARVQSLMSNDDVEHYDAIARDLEGGRLRQPAQPMTDSELAAAMAEFLVAPPTDASRASLNRRFNPPDK
jgi:hypothetical protein